MSPFFKWRRPRNTLVSITICVVILNGTGFIRILWLILLVEAKGPCHFTFNIKYPNELFYCEVSKTNLMDMVDTFCIVYQRLLFRYDTNIYIRAGSLPLLRRDRVTAGFIWKVQNVGQGLSLKFKYVAIHLYKLISYEMQNAKSTKIRLFIRKEIAENYFSACLDRCDLNLQLMFLIY